MVGHPAGLVTHATLQVSSAGLFSMLHLAAWPPCSQQAAEFRRAANRLLSFRLRRGHSAQTVPVQQDLTNNCKQHLCSQCVPACHDIACWCCMWLQVPEISSPNRGVCPAQAHILLKRALQDAAAAAKTALTGALAAVPTLALPGHLQPHLISA